MQYSARWSKTLAVNSGRYAFGLGASCEAHVLIDGRVIVSNGQRDVTIDLEAGKAYDFRVEMKKADDNFFGSVRVGMAYQPEPDTRIEQAVELAARSDVMIIYAGYPENFETEGVDRPHMDLTGKQNELIAAVAKANPMTVVVLNVGSPVTMPWADDVAAIVLAHYPGMVGADAVTDVLCGNVDPSGRLTTTWPRALKDTPAYNNYPGGRNVIYGEGIFVGYRHYDYREVEPLFAFGHGLSYAAFEYSDLKVTSQVKPGEAVKVAVTVKNVSAVAGLETVQVYVHDVKASAKRPVKELKRLCQSDAASGRSPRQSSLVERPRAVVLQSRSQTVGGGTGDV